MKKLSLLFISLFLLSGFSFAREIEEREPIRLQTNEINFSQPVRLQTPKAKNLQVENSDTNFPKKNTLKEDIQNFFTPQKQSRLINTGICITGEKLLIRDRLSTKAQEASKKILGLVELSDKINYDTKTFSSIAHNLQVIGTEISKDCTLFDFQNHRQQIKTDLDSLKVEIQSLKQYIARLRNHYNKQN